MSDEAYESLYRRLMFCAYPKCERVTDSLVLIYAGASGVKRTEVALMGFCVDHPEAWQGHPLIDEMVEMTRQGEVLGGIPFDELRNVADDLFRDGLLDVA